MSSQCKRCRCGGDHGECGSGATRREFLKFVGAAAAVSLAENNEPEAAVAGPFVAEDFEKLVPPDKKLKPEWLKSLVERGQPAVYRGAELEKIGMPIGGIGAGQVYLGGDGRLWHWDIFNQHVGTGDGHYARPMTPASPLDQGFAIRVAVGDRREVRPLDRRGFREVRFRGEYPIGRVEYADPATPVAVSLEAFSPFIPLETEDSALPATVMRFTVKNTSDRPVAVELGGWLENAVCLNAAKTAPVERRNRVVRLGTALAVECSALSPPAEQARAPRPDVLFEDFEKPTYEGWTATGTAFGDGPVEKSKMPQYQGDVGAHGNRLVNSHNVRHGEDVGGGDAHTGTLTSKKFTIERGFINLLVGGGSHAGRTCVNVLVEGKAVRSVTGRNDNRMMPQSIDVRRFDGREAEIQIVDAEKGPWGNIGVDWIVLSDTPRSIAAELADQPDFGTLVLALLESGPADRAAAILPEGPAQEAVFAVSSPGGATGSSSDRAGESPAGKPPVPAVGTSPRGGLVRKISLRPGAEQTVTFVVTWHMPNLKLDGLRDLGGRYYATRFHSAGEVVRYLAENFDRLAGQTRLWRDTWYDSTLPYWFLDRTLANTSTLATSTCFWLASGRFYGWEGVGCCQGTCTHVWQYAHAVARLFPELERICRERVDYGLSFDPGTGIIQFRGEFAHGLAVDGQAGTILRVYREHQMSPDDRFLRRLWPRVKRSLECLIAKDADGDGLLDGNQHNTLDADWFGQVAWLSSLYLAAIRAGEEMAREVGDEVFARRARAIFEVGSKSIVEKLYNGEYFFHKADPAHLGVVGSYDGCSIDQVYGQSWAFQVGLGRILPTAQTRSALQSLWKYNFTPDVGPYRERHKPGRWYAMPGEGGLLMVTFPRGVSPEFKDHPGAWSAMYFNECMTGFEHQVAGHMIWEGMVQEGLAVERMIHDRYHPSRRNPWNEVECGDHYARAMASYGVFLAACGWEYHGPSGHLGFAPRLAPENFRAAFTAAEGWGTIAQKRETTGQSATIAVRWGRLRLRSIALAALPGVKAETVQVTLADRAIPARQTVDQGRVLIALAEPLEIKVGQTVRVELA